MDVPEVALSGESKNAGVRASLPRSPSSGRNLRILFASEWICHIVRGMKIISAAGREAHLGAAEWFTGTVWMDEIVPRTPPANFRALLVTFEPAARTAWHTHPVGQALHIIAGVGRVQRAGGAIETVRAGDTVWFDPGERHWHGAAPDQMMTHLAVHEFDAAGKQVTWYEKVTDAEYGR